MERSTQMLVVSHRTSLCTWQQILVACHRSSPHPQPAVDDYLVEGLAPGPWVWTADTWSTTLLIRVSVAFSLIQRPSKVCEALYCWSVGCKSKVVSPVCTTRDLGLTTAYVRQGPIASEMVRLRVRCSDVHSDEADVVAPKNTPNA